MFLFHFNIIVLLAWKLYSQARIYVIDKMHLKMMNHKLVLSQIFDNLMLINKLTSIYDALSNLPTCGRNKNTQSFL